MQTKEAMDYIINSDCFEVWGASCTKTVTTLILYDKMIANIKRFKFRRDTVLF